MINWIKNKSNTLSTKDKVKILLKQPYNLVLVQQHELERIKPLETINTYQRDYVEKLYTHYIINRLNKTV